MNRHEPIPGHSPDCRDPDCSRTPWACDGPQTDCLCGYSTIDPDCPEHGHLASGPDDDEPVRAVAAQWVAA